MTNPDADESEKKFDITKVSKDQLFSNALKDKNKLLQLMRLYDTEKSMLENSEKGLNSFLKYCAERILNIDDDNIQASTEQREQIEYIFMFISYKGFNQVEEYVNRVFTVLIGRLNHLLNNAFHTKKFTEESLLDRYAAPLVVMMIYTE